MVKHMIYKIPLFILSTLLITVLLAMFQQQINLDYDKIVLPQLAPMLGGLIMILLFKDMRVRICLDFNKIIALKSLLAAILPFCLIYISFFIGKLAGLDIEITSDLVPVFSIMIVGICIGAAGEEFGWRSFLQAIFERNYSVLVSSIIVGSIWGLWHIGHYKNGLFFMLGFLIFTISASIVLAWILRDTKYSLIISILFHTSINLGFYVFFKNSLTNSKLMFINGIIWLITVFTIVISMGEKFIKNRK